MPWSGVLDKQSEFAKRSVHEWTANVFGDDQGDAALDPIPPDDPHRARTALARKRSTRSKKPDPYSKEQLEEVDAQYASEQPRGKRAKRYWEDVERGRIDLRPLVKGPLTVTDIVCWHVGVGMGYYGVKGLRLGYQNRQRIPGFYQPDPLHIPDQMMRVHWDEAYAQVAGAPTMYDYGRMRECWLVHLCTDWMGDEGWLWKLDCEFRRFNFVGDTQWMRGRVERKYLAEGGPARGGPRGLGREPARGGHDAGPRHPACCRAASTARCASRTRRATRRTCRVRFDALSERFAEGDG